MVRARDVFEKCMEEIVDGFQDGCDKELILVMDKAFRDGRADKAIERMWTKRFM